MSIVNKILKESKIPSCPELQAAPIGTIFGTVYKGKIFIYEKAGEYEIENHKGEGYTDGLAVRPVKLNPLKKGRLTTLAVNKNQTLTIL